MIKQNIEHRIDYQMIYRAHLSDGSIFDGGSFEYPGWKKCPSGIETLELFLPDSNDIIQLKNYEKYNFFIGAKKPLNSQNLLLAHMYGLGCKKDMVNSYRITLVASRGNKYKVGDITVRKFPYGKEGMRRTSTIGWKDGIS